MFLSLSLSLSRPRDDRRVEQFLGSSIQERWPRGNRHQVFIWKRTRGGGWLLPPSHLLVPTYSTRFIELFFRPDEGNDRFPGRRIREDSFSFSISFIVILVNVSINDYHSPTLASYFQVVLSLNVTTISIVELFIFG